MPLLNNHSCRLRPPSDIKDGSYRSREQSHNGKKYSVIYGELKSSGKQADQSYRYSKGTWDASEARSHCSSHGGTFHAAKETKEIYMSKITDKELAYINKRFAKTELSNEDVFGFNATIARSDKTTSYHTRLSKRTIEAFEKSIATTGVAMGILHAKSLPVGRVYDGKVSGNSIDAKFYALKDMSVTVSLPVGFGGASSTYNTNDIEKMIDAGTLFDVSVGFEASRELYGCNICKKPIMSMDCEHMPGQTYDGKKCFVNIDDENATLHEVSICMAGALPGAEIHSYSTKSEWISKTLQNDTNMDYAVYSTNDIGKEDEGMTEDEKNEMTRLSAEIERLTTVNVQLSAENDELKLSNEALQESNEKFASDYAGLQGTNQELEGVNLNLKSQVLGSEFYAKIGRHYNTSVEFEINRLGVALDGNDFNKELMSKQLSGLSIEDKEKIKDSLTKRLSLNVKTGVLDVNDVTVVETKKVDDSHLYKV